MFDERVLENFGDYLSRRQYLGRSISPDSQAKAMEELQNVTQGHFTLEQHRGVFWVTPTKNVTRQQFRDYVEHVLLTIIVNEFSTPKEKLFKADSFWGIAFGFAPSRFLQRVPLKEAILRLERSGMKLTIDQRGEVIQVVSTPSPKNSQVESEF